MRTRLRRELHEFLLQERISLETNIVNKLIYEMAGVTLPASDEDESTPGFDFSAWRKEESLSFYLPKIRTQQLFKLLDYFQFPRDEYTTNDHITLDEKFVFEKLLPAFKDHFKSKKPNELAPYVVKSKPILESSANTTLKERTTKAVDIIVEQINVGEIKPSETSAEMVRELGSLYFQVNTLTKWPTLYKFVTESAEKIKGFKLLPEVTKNQKLLQQFTLINEGIDLFAKYNRCESVLANKAFSKEMEEFLNNKKITSTLCNIVEDTLLSLSGAKLGENGECSLDDGHDPSRLVFTFKDIDQANTDKVVEYLQKAGDDTATEGYGSRRYGSGIPEASFAAASFAQAPKSAMHYKPEPVIESHSIETDGKVFYEVVFPSLKTAIEAMEITGELDKYRAKSAAFFAKKEVKIEKDRFFKTPEVCTGTPAATEVKVEATATLSK